MKQLGGNIFLTYSKNDYGDTQYSGRTCKAVSACKTDSTKYEPSPPTTSRDRLCATVMPCKAGERGTLICGHGDQQPQLTVSAPCYECAWRDRSTNPKPRPWPPIASTRCSRNAPAIKPNSPRPRPPTAHKRRHRRQRTDAGARRAGHTAAQRTKECANAGGFKHWCVTDTAVACSGTWAGSHWDWYSSSAATHCVIVRLFVDVFLGRLLGDYHDHYHCSTDGNHDAGHSVGHVGGMQVPGGVVVRRPGVFELCRSG